MPRYVRIRTGFCAALIAGTFAFALASPSGTAHAKEEYARKTKRACSACHTRGFPLTPFGKAFRDNNHKLPPCKRVTIKLYDRRGVYQRTYRGCFPVGGTTVTIGQ